MKSKICSISIFLLALPLTSIADNFTSSEICGDVDLNRCAAIVGRIATLLEKNSETVSKPSFVIEESSPPDTFGDFVKLKLELGMANTTAVNEDSSGTNIGREIEDQTIRSASFGIFDYPFVKDMTGIESNFTKGLTFSAYDSYGSTEKEKIDTNGVSSDKLENKNSYYVGIKYEISFDDLTKK